MKSQKRKRLFLRRKGIFREGRGPFTDAFSGSKSGARWIGQSKIEVVSDVNGCDLRCLPRPVSKGNSRSVSIVILLSFLSLSLPLSISPPCEASRVCVPLSGELQADLQGATDLYKPTKSGLSCSPHQVLKSSESTEKVDHAQWNAQKKRARDISPGTKDVSCAASE